MAHAFGGMAMHRGASTWHEILYGVSDSRLQVVVWICIEGRVHATICLLTGAGMTTEVTSGGHRPFMNVEFMSSKCLIVSGLSVEN